MKKKSLQESLLKMKYLSGIISESQYQHLSELEIDGELDKENVPVDQNSDDDVVDIEKVVDAPIEKFEDEPITQDPGVEDVVSVDPEQAIDFKMPKTSYFNDKEEKDDFSPTSDDDVEELYELLRTDGVKNFKKTYPKWVFECLFTEDYLQKDPITKKWTLSDDGRLTFRDSFSLQKYLKTNDEGDYELDVLKNKKKKGEEEFEFEPEEFELDEEKITEDSSQTNYYKGQLAQVKVGATQYHPTIKVFANGNGHDTKHMDLNKESATVFVEWLTQNFINIPTGFAANSQDVFLDKNVDETSSKFGQATPIDLRSDEQKKISKLFDKKNDTKWVDDFKKGNNDNKSLFKNK